MQPRFVLLYLCCIIIYPPMLSAQPLPQILVGGGHPWCLIPDGDTTPSEEDGTDYGGVNVNDGTSTSIFEIRNDKSVPLTIYGIWNEGTNSSDFESPYIRRYPFTIEAYGSSQIHWRFDPSDYGVRTATLMISSDDINLPTYDFTLQGFGGTPDIEVQGGNPYQSITDGDNTPSSDDDTDFGNVNVADGWSAHYFKIMNTGDAVLTINGLGNSGSQEDDFYKINRCVLPIVIKANGSWTLDYKFDPSDVGVRTTTITVSSDDPDEGTFDFAVQGTGGTTEINVKGNGNSITDGDGYSTHNGTAFGNVFIGSSDTHTFTIENTGTGDLQLNGLPKVSVGGTHASDFTVSVQPANRITSGGGATTFDVQFHPSAPGQRIASLSIDNNDADENPYDIFLDGYGRIEVTFTHGADASLNFMQSPPAPPVNNWPMGQFSLSASENAALTYVVVDLNGNYSGLSGGWPG